MSNLHKIFFYPRMAISIVLLLLLLPFGRAHEVKAPLYTNVILPCEFPFIRGLENLFVSWEKEDDRENTVVHSFYDNADHPEDQSPQYRGRTGLIKKISSGIISLELKEVRPSDAGIYICRGANVINRGDRQILLTIDELKAVGPKVTTEEKGGEKFLKCVSSGLYKNPRVEWHDRYLNDLTSYAKTNVGEEQSDGTRTVESVLNLSFKTNEHYLCHIHEEHLKRSVRAVPSDGETIELNDEL